MEPSVWTTLFLVTVYLLGKMMRMNDTQINFNQFQREQFLTKFQSISKRTIFDQISINFEENNIWPNPFPSALFTTAKSPGKGSRTRGWDRRACLQGRFLLNFLLLPFFVPFIWDIFACKVDFYSTFCRCLFLWRFIRTNEWRGDEGRHFFFLLCFECWE